MRSPACRVSLPRQLPRAVGLFLSRQLTTLRRFLPLRFGWGCLFQLEGVLATFETASRENQSALVAERSRVSREHARAEALLQTLQLERVALQEQLQAEKTALDEERARRTAEREKFAHECVEVRGRTVGRRRIVTATASRMRAAAWEDDEASYLQDDLEA